MLWAILPRMRTLLTTLHSKYIHASLALPYLAAFCQNDCGELIISEQTVHEPKEKLLAKLLGHQPDVITFSVYLWNRVMTLELVCCLKEIAPQLKIVLGGPEVSFEDADFFARYPVDALICGEGELPLRHLLQSWQSGSQVSSIPGLRLPAAATREGHSQLDSLDELPSPFAAGLVDLRRGLVYYETSRGCPYCCSFCMSALDARVRSFSMPRIFSDLQLLIDAEVTQIKFVDRTFNYDNRRSREIFDFILRQNKSSRFHFEIGAHLLDEETLKLLEQVPPGVFQFEIGVQSTHPETLEKIGRTAELKRLAENVQRLRKPGNIHLHLDLITGLPGESYQQFLQSLDWTARLRPHHLQVEPVKLLPGSPLRQQAQALGLKFDPNPPYSILRSPEINYQQIEQLRGVSRLLDLLVNSGRFTFLLPQLIDKFKSLSGFLVDLEAFWRTRNLFQGTTQLREFCLQLDGYLQQRFSASELEGFREALARDYAHIERVVSGSEPDFFNVALSEEEKTAVRLRVKQEVAQMDRRGKVQFFAAVFQRLPGIEGRRVLLFLYHTRTGRQRQIREVSVD